MRDLATSNGMFEIDELVIPDDNTCPEEVVAMVEPVEPKMEDFYPPEPGEFGEIP